MMRPWEGPGRFLWCSEPDHEAQRQAAEAAEAEKERAGILKGLEFIERRARRPETVKFWREMNQPTLEKLEEKCKSAS